MLFRTLLADTEGLILLIRLDNTSAVSEYNLSPTCPNDQSASHISTGHHAWSSCNFEILSLKDANVSFLSLIIQIIGSLI